jgi:serine/threonine protein kinase
MELCTMTLRTAMNRINKELDQDIQKGVTIIGAYISTEIFSEILEGVNYLHSQKPPILHRDLKMSNILFTNGKSGNFIKLSDFGLSTIHGAEINDSDVSEKIDINLKHSQNRGTFKYMAEEVKKGKYDTSADVFSLGVILCELLCIDSNTSPNFKDVHRRDNRYYPLNQIKVINM